MTMCFTKVYQPGKLLTLSSCFRHCSSFSQPLKTEPGGSTVLKESTRHPGGVSLSIPPVLFIAKYNRLIETSNFGRASPTTTTTPHSKENNPILQQDHNELDDRLEANNWQVFTFGNPEICTLEMKANVIKID